MIDTDGDLVDVAGQLWTVSATQGLVRWDPHTGAAMTRFAAPPLGPPDASGLSSRWLFSEGGSFWSATDGPDGEVVRRDPVTLEAVTRVRLPGLAAVSHGGGQVWYQARTATTDLTIGHLDPTSGTVLSTTIMKSFIAQDSVGGKSVQHTYVPALQVDADGFWFVMPDLWQQDPSAPSQTIPSIYGPYAMPTRPYYRWAQ